MRRHPKRKNPRRRRGVGSAACRSRCRCRVLVSLLKTRLQLSSNATTWFAGWHLHRTTPAYATLQPTQESSLRRGFAWRRRSAERLSGSSALHSPRATSSLASAGVAAQRFALSTSLHLSSLVSFPCAPRRAVAGVCTRMSSPLYGGATTARDQEKSAARSAKLTDLFERLAAADARARHCGSIEIEDTDDVGNVSSPGPSEQARHSRRQRKRAPVSGNAGRAPLPSFGSPVHHQSSAVSLRNGRAVVLSANGRRLPPAFYEQARVLGNVEATAAEVQSTLQKLRRNLAVRSRKPSDACSNARGSSSAHVGGRENTAGSAGSPYDLSSGLDRGVGGTLTSSAARQRLIAAEEAKMEKLRVQRARVAAADEGASDDRSVEDYGVDCEVPPLSGESHLASEVAFVAEHFAKTKDSALAMAEVEELAPTTSAAPWWSSALRLRDMKASAARLGYHARAALNWSYRAREQLLLQVAHLNNISASIRSQLLQQQQRLQEFQTRLRDGHQAVTQMQAAIAQWQVHAQTESGRRAELQEELLARAREIAVVDASERNHLKAELALLLTEREWPSPSLQRDAQAVLEWLRCPSTLLE
ncbi:hypothetical protein ABL78_7709 [Leptomonas seymouri]|uniref:Uncharacterized protein n=1 Tax=Leptomonas seymouri TaxID=5684 RepID=A0A0N1PAB8_LEPSE|nr:hypothetical protein ABL78_7709 [Leptomonas seymouri]|eukprot:KPI83264.1 hypothetical protein ABL78_7709 [Leptomonas seymouri]